MIRVLVLNGPNLGSLGRREPDIYGPQSLADIDAELRRQAAEQGIDLRTEQSNSEGRLIDILEEEAGRAGAVVINPGALSHTSVALLDALRGFPGAVVEVHLSNTFRREGYRHVMLTAEVADCVILGLGPQGYPVALDAAVRIIRERQN
jgi:3-dehydroquinate dehydratase-2